MTPASLAYGSARTAVTQVSYRAGIDDIDIGDVVEVPLYKASGAHLVANSLTISLINLAT